MAATVRLKDVLAVTFDAIKPTQHTPRAVLLSLEGRVPGAIHNCAVIPLERVGEIIATLQLVADAAREA